MSGPVWAMSVGMAAVVGASWLLLSFLALFDRGLGDDYPALMFAARVTWLSIATGAVYGLGLLLTGQLP